LDENILYHAIRGVDRHVQPDLSARDLLALIVKNCHTLVLHPDLEGRYRKHLAKLQYDRPPNLELVSAIIQLLHNTSKRAWEYEALPSLPQGVDIPTEDPHIVRAALISRPIVVTDDEKLWKAIASQPILGLEARYPAAQALELARDS